MQENIRIELKTIKMKMMKMMKYWEKCKTCISHLQNRKEELMLIKSNAANRDMRYLGSGSK